eukprot:2284461-Amphidinium_carterae.1
MLSLLPNCIFKGVAEAEGGRRKEAETGRCFGKGQMQEEQKVEKMKQHERALKEMLNQLPLTTQFAT